MSRLIDRLSKEAMHEFGAMSRDAFELLLPPADIFEDSSDLVVMLDMPGFDKKSINTRLSDYTLTISARREPPEKNGISYWEQRPLRVHKRISLPVKVNTEEGTELKATYENGVLTIRLPIKGSEKITVE
ncbi:MAG: archaeal heat shock protein Hsp14 [Nitrososphaerales archaeon]